jgi:CheY-like chemotaxis protein
MVSNSGSLARLMGGDVGLESEPGKGSRFWFRVRAGLAAVDGDSRQMARAANGRGLTEAMSAQLSGRVLVADDDPTNQKVAQAMLRALGVSALPVEDGKQAVDAIERGEAVDLILMDLHMPVMDGYAATERIRQWEKEQGRARRPIIALTADAFEVNRQHCLAVGMDDFLTKPIQVEVLHTALGKWLATVPVAGEGAETAAPAQQALDIPHIVALVAEIVPLLEQNKFDAVGRFQELEAAVAGSQVAAEVAEAGRQLQEFRFDLALLRLHQIAMDQGWEDRVE